MKATHASDAATAFRMARRHSGSHLLGWKLVRAERSQLIDRFPPAYAHHVADHVTLAAKVAAGLALPPETEGAIVGRADVGDGIEAMVVEIGGTTDRPDGSTYHITWSLDAGRGRRAVESNSLLAEQGFKLFDAPVCIRLVPGLWGRRR